MTTPNSELEAENDRLRALNAEMREALQAARPFLVNAVQDAPIRLLRQAGDALDDVNAILAKTEPQKAEGSTDA
jgi:hypothetical protein